MIEKLTYFLAGVAVTGAIWTLVTAYYTTRRANQVMRRLPGDDAQLEYIRKQLGRADNDD